MLTIFLAALALLVLLRAVISANCFSLYLGHLNHWLLGLFVTLVLLRYIREICLLFGMDTPWTKHLEFWVSPVYGAILVMHIFVNHHFFTVQWKARIGIGQNRGIRAVFSKAFLRSLAKRLLRIDQHIQ